MKTASAAALRCSFTVAVLTSKGHRFHRRQTAIPAVCDGEKESYIKPTTCQKWHDSNTDVTPLSDCVCWPQDLASYTHTQIYCILLALSLSHTDDSVFSACHISSVKDYSQRLQ